MVEEKFNMHIPLEEAREIVSKRLEEGIRCPCCDQYARMYKRKINSAMSWVLIIIYNYYAKEGSLRKWIHVENYLKSHPNLPASLRGDFPKLRHWGLIEEQKKEKRDDGSRRVGYYKITKKGILFVEKKIRVSKYVFIFNQKVEGFSDESCYIRECLGEKFNYSELMGYKTFAGDVILDNWVKQGMHFKQVEGGWYECYSDSGEKYRCHPFEALCSCPAYKYGKKQLCKHLKELYERLKTTQGIEDLDESKIQKIPTGVKLDGRV